MSNNDPGMGRPRGASVVHCEPLLIDTRNARQIFGGIAENTLRPLLAKYGVEPVNIGRRVLWYIVDLRRVADALRSEGEESEGTA